MTCLSARCSWTARYGVQTLVTVDNRPELIAAWLAALPKGAVVAMEATGIYHRLLAHLAPAKCRCRLRD